LVAPGNFTVYRSLLATLLYHAVVRRSNTARYSPEEVADGLLVVD
jgi:hypothetical protein